VSYFLVKVKNKGFLAWSISVPDGYYFTDDLEKAQRCDSIKEAAQEVFFAKEYIKINKRDVAVLINEEGQLYRIKAAHC
jgi:hypothetical protein